MALNHSPLAWLAVAGIHRPEPRGFDFLHSRPAKTGIGSCVSYCLEHLYDSGVYRHRNDQGLGDEDEAYGCHGLLISLSEDRDF